MSERSIRRAIVVCFLASGAAGLVYQVLWTRQLSLIFGVTTYAVATVLATFMGGLALGSFFLGHRLALERLAPDGLMMQWIPTGEAPLDQERMLFRAFSDVFPHVTAWRQLDSGCMLLIGSRTPLTIDYLRLRARMEAPRIRRDMELSGVREAEHLLSFFVFDEPAFAEFVRDVPPVTDDRTVLDFTIPRHLGSGFGLGSWNTRAQQDGRNPFGEAMIRMNYYAQHRRSVVPLLTNLGGEPPQAIAQRIAARASITIPNAWIPEAQWRRWDAADLAITDARSPAPAPSP